MIIYIVETWRRAVFPGYCKLWGVGVPFLSVFEMAFEGEVLADRWLSVPLGFFGSSASVDQVRPTNLKPFGVCLGCLTVSVFLFSLADHHGVTNTILPWKTVPCHLLACASWRWKPTMPLTSTETCMSALPYRALRFLCFLQQACSTRNESKNVVPSCLWEWHTNV